MLLLSLGTTPPAVGGVLAAFMGGMAIGAWSAGRAVLQRLPPVVAFAGLELWVGVYALVTPLILDGVHRLDPGAQLVMGLIALLPATVAMGASLPLLARALDGPDCIRATTVGWLYAANTAGGVTGPLLAVFVLFPGVGLAKTLVVAAGINILVGMTLLTRRGWTSGVSLAPRSVLVSRAVERFPDVRSLAGILAVSGATAMIYEMAWSRTLSMVYGSSVYGVSITLSTFLAGIACGSWGAAVRFRTRTPSVLVAVWLLVGSAWTAFLSLSVGGRLPLTFLDLYRWAEGGLAGLSTIQCVLAALLMMPTTLCLGAIIPVAIGIASRGTENAQPLISRLYAANLVGSAVGALVASGLLIASVGLSLAVQVAVLLAFSMGLLATFRLSGSNPGTIGVTALAVVLVLVLDGGARQLALSVGLYHGAPEYVSNDDQGIRDLLASHELLFYRDGPTASVAVQKVDRYLLMKINGKTDASTGAGDIETQTLLGHLPLMAVDRPERVGVVGLGSGMTAGAVLTHPVREVDVFEIEPAVVEASRYFESLNGRPLDDPRLRLVMGDARGSLRKQHTHYDVIISEPSNPWMTGVANLFTREFFELAASRLAPGGLMAQWFHLYGMSEESAREVVATFQSVFPHTVAFKDRDLILLGSDQPIGFALDRMEHRFAEPAVRASLAEAFVRYPADLLVKLRLDENGVEAYAAGAPLNTDDNMRLELASPRALYDDRLASIRSELDEFPPAPLSLLTGYGSQADVEIELAASYFTAGRQDEALRHCERALALESSFEGLKLLGQIAERRGDQGRARNAWRLALASTGAPEHRALIEAMLSGIDPA